MSAAEINDGGPAFPVNDMQRAHDIAAAATVGIEDHEALERAYIQARGTAIRGMSLRDYFAAAALQGMLSRPNSSPQGHPKSREGYAAASFEQADAMLKARSA